MAILYVFSVTDPNDVGPFPPSVMASSWNKSIQEHIVSHAAGNTEIFSMTVLDDSSNYVAFFFNDEDEFSSFMSSHTITDASLLADIDAWKIAHSITYDYKIYSITDTGASTPKIV
jgi:hypothetical protein